jgi:predicted phage terminase large subunit-like protein
MIKRIIECSAYKQLFDVHIRSDSKAKEHFMTTAGGSIRAFGSSGGIVGQDGGLPNLDRFSGAVLMDDLHKIDEAHSESIREGVIRNYRETILQRPRSPNIPMIYIGQRVHEADVAAFMLSGEDERTWKSVILKAIDGAGNALYPDVNPLEQLLLKKQYNPYVFSSQYQQEPIPAGGSLFKREYFALLDEDPTMLCTFITADTAETNKSYNDASAFSFWGLYYLEDGHTLALHWIDAQEARVEPKDLQEAFLSFYADCMRYPIKPQFAAIEKKSTGVTLLSVLSELRGLQLREVKRTAASGSKTTRFLEMQPIVASKLLSFTKGAFHVEQCITHMMKITANDSHKHDDLADTLYDAVKIGLIDKTLYIPESVNESKNAMVKNMAQEFNHRAQALNRARDQRSRR